ncbi:pentatricopeptide repeat (PPR-like) superfamily protein [Actinidia rufa]|uniref:Pentatricopeptide repeat (PPR-like) superfamily protein n=1 Tax=Actinidia rufa TaxID=165716 RepID=A0A7J0GQQ7_9ERIC|nr:pentatricopeptide repeat (PPR-like) superfamily protein [Actinidia rufa]
MRVAGLEPNQITFICLLSACADFPLPSLSFGMSVHGYVRCSSRRYRAPAPNRVGNGVRTRPHAPFEDRRVRSVSATRQHAPGGVCTRGHAPRVGFTRPHARLTRQEGAEGHIKRDCPKYKAQVQSSDTAATAVMADDDEIDVLLAASDDGKSDWVLDSGSAYHLCRDREVLSIIYICSMRGTYMDGEQTRLAEFVGRWSVRFRMADGSFEASGGILRVSKGNKEMLWGKKTRGLYRLKGNVQTGGVTVRHGSSGISEKNGQEKQPLHRGTQSKRRGTWRIRSVVQERRDDALGYVRKSGQTRVMQPVQDVHREAQRKETKSIFEKLYSEGRGDAETSLFCSRFDQCGVFSPVVRTREERWSHDNSQSDVLCGAPRWGFEHNIEDAIEVVDEMPERDAVSWTALVGEERSEEALEFFNWMQKEGFETDGVSFTGALAACGHAGLIEEGLKLFDVMKRVRRISLRIEHYGCIVDLYSRAGRTRGDVQIAERLMNYLLEFDPNSAIRTTYSF